MSPKVSEVVCSIAKKYPERNRKSDYLPRERKSLVDSYIATSEIMFIE